LRDSTLKTRQGDLLGFFLSDFIWERGPLVRFMIMSGPEVRAPTRS